MDAEKQADMIVARLRAECSKIAPRPPYAVGILMLFGVIFATAVIFY
jgi:hypothetical protein